MTGNANTDKSICMKHFKAVPKVNRRGSVLCIERQISDGDLRSPQRCSTNITSNPWTYHYTWFSPLAQLTGHEGASNVVHLSEAVYLRCLYVYFELALALSSVGCEAERACLSISEIDSCHAHDRRSPNSSNQVHRLSWGGLTETYYPIQQQLWAQLITPQQKVAFEENLSCFFILKDLLLNLLNTLETVINSSTTIR